MSSPGENMMRLFASMNSRPWAMCALNHASRPSTTVTVAVFSGKVASDSGGIVRCAVKTVEPPATPASVWTSTDTGIAALPGGHGSSVTGSPLTFGAGSTATRRLTGSAGFGTPLWTSNAIEVVAALPVTDGTGAD